MTSGKAGQYAGNNEKWILSRMEKMLNAKQIHYFDVSEYAEAIDIYLDYNEIKKAEQIVEIAINQHPGANDLLLKRAQILVEKRSYKKAGKILAEIEPLEPTNADILMLQGILNLYQYETYKAIEYFNKAIDHSYDDEEEFILNIAIHFENVKLFDQAIFFLAKAHKMNPKNEDIVYELAFAYERTANFEESINHYKKYLELNPFSENGWYNIALIYDRLEQYDNAIEAFDFALAIDNEYMLAYYGKGNTLANKHEYLKAANVFIEALAFEEENDELLYSIGECYEKLEDYNASLQYYKKALDMNDKNDNAWFGIGLIRFYKNELFESLFYVKKALKINPDDTEYWSILAQINEKLDFYEDAEEAYQKALDIDAYDELTWIKYSELLYKQDKIEEAVDTLIEATQKLKDNSELIYRLSAYLLESKHSDKAIDYFKLGLSLDYNKHTKFFEFDTKKKYISTINSLIKNDISPEQDISNE